MQKHADDGPAISKRPKKGTMYICCEECARYLVLTKGGPPDEEIFKFLRAHQKCSGPRGSKQIELLLKRFGGLTN